jgi:hypothetical protein
MIPWILIAIAAAVVILGIIFIFALKKGKTRPPDYFAFFWMGIIWMIAGAIPLIIHGWESTLNFLFFMGVIFFIVGIVNKDKWKKNRVRFKDLTKKEQKFRIIIIVLLGILVAIGLFFFLLAQYKAI